LDHHIQCGNSLLGTTPALLALNLPTFLQILPVSDSGGGWV